MDEDFISGLDPYIGAVRRRSRRRGSGSVSPYSSRSGGRRTTSSRPSYDPSMRRPGYASVPGAPAVGDGLLPAGWDPFIFNAASGINTVTQVMNPQTAFRGQRWSVVVVRNGASALLSAPLATFFVVGMKPILVTGAVAIETFNQNAFDTNLLLPPTLPGVTYTLALRLSAALTGTDTISVFPSLIGSAYL